REGGAGCRHRLGLLAPGRDVEIDRTQVGGFAVDPLTDCLALQPSAVQEVNRLLQDPNKPVIRALTEVVRKYGTPEEINAQAREARKLSNLLQRLQEMESPHLKGVEWLMAQRDEEAFISMESYRRKVLGDRAD